MQYNTQAVLVPKRRVVDAFTRTLHALMAVSFGLAYITSEMDGLRLVHVTLGYTLGAVFLVRVVWGAVGPRRVSLWVLGEKLRGIGQLAESIRRRDWRSALKTLLAVSMVTLLVSMFPVVASGYVTYFKLLGQWTKEVHELLGNVMVLAVSCHVGAVVLLGLGHFEGQIRPMWTGLVAGKGPDLVKKNLTSAAVAVVLLMVSFWSWQMYQYIHDPQLKHQLSWLHPEGGYQEEGED